MVVLEECMHSLDFLRCETFDDEQLIVAAIELGARLARRIDLNRLRSGQWFTVLNVVDAEAFAEIAEYERAIFLDFEMWWHIFSAGKGGGEGKGRKAYFF